MTFLSGLGLMLSLIVAIGAQNVFVLRQGIRREHVGLVVAICAISDAVLVAVGVSGIGAAVNTMPWLVTAATWAGAAFLFVYAALAARRAFTSQGEALGAPDATADRVVPATIGIGSHSASSRDAGSLDAGSGGDSSVGDDFRTAGGKIGTGRGVAPVVLASASSVAMTCLALTWLNPHVYLDTVFLIGTVATSHGDARWLFALGAMTGSVLWFTALGYGARMLGRVLARPSAWRILDGVIAVMMAVMGVMLLVL